MIQLTGQKDSSPFLSNCILSCLSVWFYLFLLIVECAISEFFIILCGVTRIPLIQGVCES